MGLKKRILLIDDDPQILDCMQAVIETNGYDVSTAPDGSDGFKQVLAFMPDLIVLDMMMPKSSGFMVLQKLNREQIQGIPVIMITANDGTRHRFYAEQLGVKDYLQKPFTMDQLMAAIEKQMEEFCVAS